MRYRKLGQNGPTVSAIRLGAGLGGHLSRRRSKMRARAASLAAILAFAVSNAASAADRLYTAYNIWFEQPTKVYSTGYQKGNILPAGSEVKDVNRSRSKVEFTDVKLNMKFSAEF